MLKIIFSSLVLCLSLLCGPAASPAAEDMFPGKWWHIPQVCERLQLTDSQKERLDDLFNDNRRKLTELKDKLEAEKAKLDDFMGKEPFNETAVVDQLQNVESIRTKLAAERFRFLIEMRKILAADQFEQLKAFFRDYRDKNSPDAAPPVPPSIKKSPGASKTGPS